MKKIFIPILIVVFVVGLVVATSKNTIARVSVEKGVEIVTGLRLKIEKMDVGIITTLVGINNLELFNPPQFEDKIMLDMPEVYVDYNLPEIIRGKIHLNEVRVEVKEFTVVKNTDGELNLNSIKVVKKQKREEPTPKEKAEMPQIQIDVLRLKIGKVVYKDYSKGGKPQVQEFNIGLDEQYSDINDPNEFVSLIVVKALSNTTIARLANFDLKDLQGTITDTLASSQKIVGGAQQILSGTTGAVAGTTDQVKSVLKETTETAESAVKDISEAIKLPFASEEK
jgi:hypothetical protein